MSQCVENTHMMRQLGTDRESLTERTSSLHSYKYLSEQSSSRSLMA